MHENRWSPFDPEWYKLAFDKFISTADMLFNQNDIINQGYVIPDADGSKSSVFRNNAVLNNSFNEQALRETLKDIYLNSTNTLTANNHDTVQFYQYQTSMRKINCTPNTMMCQFTIPSDRFFPDNRDMFKLKQFYRKWISIQDMLNNWQTFKWAYLVFINQRIYSEYEIRIDDHEITIRFPYYEHWLNNDYPIYVYKFATNSQCRMKIAKYQLEQWNYQIPIDQLPEATITNSDHVIAVFNRIGDPTIRSDKKTNVDVMGDNLEFLTIHDGILDLTNISEYNKDLILSETKEYIWMSLIVPKFFNEYPILLPTDVVFRPYIFDMSSVSVNIDGEIKHVKSGEIGESLKQVYANEDGHINEKQDGWKYMIRPVVLSDAYKEDLTDPYEVIGKELNTLKELTIKAADINETLYFMDKLDVRFVDVCNELDSVLNDIHTYHNNYLRDKKMEMNQEYDIAFNHYQEAIKEVIAKHNPDLLFTMDDGKSYNIFTLISPCIYMPRDLVDKYNVAITIAHVSRHGNLWNDIDQYKNQLRFTHPVDATDFWTFEYDSEKEVWRPYILNVEKHFPDVYTLTDPNESTPTPNRIFKAFIFYSDNINTRTTSTPIVSATPSWDVDMENFMYDKGGIYRDIFMEKFYWMGINSIYKGIIQTKYRWELIEYIIDNSSYERFNDLFLKSMDPYFKLGLATYLKSDNFEFPFDDAISKMQESINQQFIGYQKVTNYEMYLNKTWIPSYFDYIISIMDNFEYEPMLVHRPRTTFDTQRLLPLLMDIQTQIHENAIQFKEDLDWINSELSINSFGMDVNNVVSLQRKTESLESNLMLIYDTIVNLDMDIFSNDDINFIIGRLSKHKELIDGIKASCDNVYNSASKHGMYNWVRQYYDEMMIVIDEKLRNTLESMSSVSSDSVEYIAAIIMDPNAISINNVTNDSIIGYINQFTRNWTDIIKSDRNELYTTTVKMYELYNVDKSYTIEEFKQFHQLLKDVSSLLITLQSDLMTFFNGVNIDYRITDLIDYVIDYTDSLQIKTSVAIDSYNQLIAVVNEFIDLTNAKPITSTFVTDTEHEIMNSMKDELNSLMKEYSYFFRIHDNELISSILLNLINNNEELLKFNDHVRMIFKKVFATMDTETGFVSKVYPFNLTIDSIIEYMDTVNEKYIPDTEKPNFANVYQVSEIEITSNGFNHKLGDNVYVPNLGVYTITEINDDNSIAVNVIPCVNTSFRNPLWQSRSYDSITSGDGIGLTITPTKIETTVLISDKLANGYISRVSNCINELYNNIVKYNPIANIEADITTDNINAIKSDWDSLMEIYIDHMSPDLANQVSDLILSTYEGIDSIKSFEEVRSNINPTAFVYVFEDFLSTCYKTYSDHYTMDPHYKLYDDRVRNAYNALLSFMGNGSSWSNIDQLFILINDALREIDLFRRMVLMDTDFIDDVDPMIDQMKQIAETIQLSRNLLDTKRVGIEEYLDSIVIFLHDITEDRQIDSWYQITGTSVAESGSGYSVGDIVEAVTAEGDSIYIQIKQVNETGGVIKASPLISYTALQYQINGAYEAASRVGNGTGFIVYISSVENLLEKSTLFVDTSSDVQLFDENDMMKFTFANSHDLDIGYEVFLSGKQITDFILRHESSTDGDFDVVYINANQVMSLSKSSILTEGEHYYTYKLDRLEIIDPGAGYSVGQTILVNTDSVPLKLIVTELDGTPYNGIKSVEFAENKSSYNSANPSSSHAEVIPDAVSNIDDEYSSTYYDSLDQNGIIKPATFSFDPNTYAFTSTRFDELTSGDRNTRYMYSEIPKPDGAPNGDPDHGWYQGVRLNEEHRWCGINPIIPIKDPSIMDDINVPPNQPRTAEFQFLQRLRIHDSSAEVIPTLQPISAEDIESIVAGADPNPSEDFSVDQYIISPITNHDVEGMFDGTVTGEVNDPIIADDGIIVGIDKDDIHPLMKGEKIPEITQAYIDGSVMSNDVTEAFAITFINSAIKSGVIEVATYADIPKHISEWRSAKIGDGVIVTNDETHEGHRMIYRLRTFSGTGGYFVYERPEVADYKWITFNIDWMKSNFYPDIPSLKAMYPGAPWNTANKFTLVENAIDDNKVSASVTPTKYMQTYIKDLTIDDLSVFNHTLNKWEDLSDTSKWKLDVRNDNVNNDWGFTLTYLEDGAFSYDMSLYLNKKPSNQIRNASLKRNAVFDISAVIDGEVNTPSINSPINVGRHLRIRRLFPFEQKETFTISKDLGYNMDFTISSYPYYRNELHLEDIQIYNKTAGRFENVLNTKMFEVQFKDNKAVARGKETQTNIIQSIISDSGSNFVDGEVWGYNEEYNTQVFGQITVDHDTGAIMSFIPVHTVNPPTEDVMIDFKLYQSTSEVTPATVIMEFQTKQTTVWGDGYIHNVQNRLAPLPKQFRIVCLYDLDEPTEYEITISTTPKTWEFVLPEDKVFPVFHIPGYIIPQDHLYIIGSKGRYPLVNPATGKPSIVISYTDDGTDVKFLNLYYAYEKLEIHYTPYPMRSVYTQRRVGSSGYINLAGKINKPLNKKYFEFWMNGRLLHDEVTIITPTKIFIHGAKSLRNFELIEINRDSNEFFADDFLSVTYSDNEVPSAVWNLDTYLDDALQGTLKGENYTVEEQSMLLSPVWPQVDSHHNEFMNYPSNMDSESDILLKVDENFVAVSDVTSSYQYTVVDVPSVEGVAINDRNLTFGKFGFTPITEDMIINLLNEEWKAELESGLLPSHSVISDDEWYGLLVRLYDDHGNQVHSLSEAAYKIVEPNMLRINDKTKLVRITRNPTIYDLD